MLHAGGWDLFPVPDASAWETAVAGSGLVTAKGSSRGTMPRLNPIQDMITNLEELYCDQLRDLYSAETQLIAALPEMVTASSNSDLREGFSKHLEETRGHRSRLDTICARRGISPEGEDCEAMRGLIKEAKKHVGETLTGEVRDAVLIASANRVEHYEIAAYGVTRAFAKALGYDDDAKLLGESLDEEAATDDALTKIATGGLFSSGVNAAAIH